MVIDGLAMVRAADPSFRALLVNFQLYGVFEKADVALTRYIIDSVALIVRRRAPGLKRSERKVVATTVVNVITGALFLSQREEPAMARKLLAETKILLRRYLEPYTTASGEVTLPVATLGS